MITVIFSNHARRNLKHIEDYYRGMGNVKKGRTIRTNILNLVGLLPQNHRLGRVEDHFSHLPIVRRFLVEGNYKIIYKQVDDETIIITDIFNCRQDPRKMKG